MPSHLASALKCITAIKLKKQGLSQAKISKLLGINRSTVSHYLHGRNVSPKSLKVAKIIINFCPRDFILFVQSVIEKKEEVKTIVKTCQNRNFKVLVKDSCIGCGTCSEKCPMDAIKISGLKAKVNSKLCCGCEFCIKVCKTNSIEIMEVKNNGN
ncbi:formylmethanofuran dehydrogenase, subunit H [Methanothermus fervidus DSM 2088]|uniref:Formylmethanofuran dehydrogenase, subunit H n=1 Tax=Methanothermus fervidus (strain ATCC 43054 / DSM 2088 / JCM 10308 / V24 S) TaxID=523846 RepID=E3GW06_METFV|nr:4Fe-4S binding protein [Methanothermus fervidus]ADP77771.1 formylmethanofuran dehydrogenase, subunit H [Methanothermus fervidus DSM 2088]